ncbi:MAG: hypothetical protein S4CHLAM123_00540 [Chlamydiales bacterium]|nr:hypothetical protein [Chlamydiales bacterium]
MSFQIEYSGFEQRLLIHNKPFVAHVYEGLGDVPEGFNTVCITLDAQESSLLNWEQDLQRAVLYAQKGYFILWELDLQVCEGSLEDEGRFKTLQLSVNHFSQTVLPKFLDQTLGVAFFRGELQLETRGEVLDYLKLLAAQLPEEVLCFLYLDTSAMQSAALFFQLINQEAFGFFHLFLKGPFVEKYPFAVAQFGWGHSQSVLGCTKSQISLQSRTVSLGVLLPEVFELDVMDRLVAELKERPFRVIPENLLTQEWDGLEHLIVLSNFISNRGQRKLLGFSAASGNIIKYPDDAAALQLLETSPLFSLPA